MHGDQMVSAIEKQHPNLLPRRTGERSAEVVADRLRVAEHRAACAERAIAFGAPTRETGAAARPRAGRPPVDAESPGAAPSSSGSDPKAANRAGVVIR